MTVRGLILGMCLLVAAVAAGTGEDLKRATEFERIGDFESALAVFEGVYARTPDNAVAVEGMKRNYARLGHTVKLTGLYGELAARTPDKPAPALELADLLLQSDGNEERADSLIKAALGHDGGESGYARGARIYVKHGLPAKALDTYTAYRHISGNDNAFVEEAAVACRQLGRYHDMAAEYMKLTVELNQEAYTYLSGMFERLGGDRKAYDALTGALEDMAAAAPEDKQYLFYKLVRDLHMLFGNADAAFETVKLMERVSPRNGKDLHGFAAWCRNELMHRAAMRADAYLITVAPKSPFVPDAYYNRAMSAVELGEFDAGRALLDTVITRYRKHKLAPQARYALGELFFKSLQQPGKAVEFYAHIVRKHPRSGYAVDALFRIGDCMVASGNLTKAERQFTELKVKARGNKENVNRARLALCEVLFMQRKFDAARTQVTPLADERGTLYRNDALVLSLLLEEDDTVLAPYAGALLLERRMDFAAARDAWQGMLAAVQGALNERVRLNLAAAYRKSGTPERAVETYRNFLQELPESPLAPQAGFQLGQLLEERGDADGAGGVYRELLKAYPLSPLVPRVRFRLRNL